MMTMRLDATPARMRRWSRAPLALVLSLLCAPAAVAAHAKVHPVVHTGLATHPAPKRIRRQSDDDKPAAKSAPKGKAAAPKKGAKSSRAAKKAAPTPKTKHHARPQEADDADPPVLVRTKKHSREKSVASRRDVRQMRPAPIKKTAPVARHLAASGESTLPATPNTRTDATADAKKPLTSDDFLRAAGVAATPAPDADEKPVTGESHPADDERLPLRAASRVPAPISRVEATAAMTADSVSAVNPAPHAITQSHSRHLQMPETEPAKEAVVQEAMVAPVPTLLSRGGHLVVPPPMKGTREILAHQNAMADSEGLSRIQDDDDLDRMRAQKLLVPLVGSASLEINPQLPANRRFARPWTAHFVADTARAFAARFDEPLRLNSAVRTVAYQLRLQRVNGNAAGIDGDTASPHLTGQAIDFGKRGMSTAEIAWMRAYLTPLVASGVIDVEEEFQQACFHISVYRSYAPANAPRSKPTRTEVAQLRTPAARTHAASRDDDDRME